MNDSAVFFLKAFTTPCTCWECCSSATASFWMNSTAAEGGGRREGRRERGREERRGERRGGEVR